MQRKPKVYAASLGLWILLQVISVILRICVGLINVSADARFISAGNLAVLAENPFRIFFWDAEEQSGEYD